MRRVGTCWHQQSVRDLRCVFDEIADHCALALVELAIEVAIQWLAVDGRIGCNYLQRGGVGGEREIAVGVERLSSPDFVERRERSSCPATAVSISASISMRRIGLG